jgi:hypothetical protein
MSPTPRGPADGLGIAPAFMANDNTARQVV